ncbi:hypothetical protein H0H93_002723 [Arthromyces matolae]|nr:hypothetical protein H0H93_002723 [Arthromyces matolae]
MDASRNDGTFVMLKQLDTTSPSATQEIVIGQLFSSAEFSADPRNHCVPILEVIPPKEGSRYSFIVIPLLYEASLAPFETIGEVVEYTRQIFEGLQFMHQLNVTHA